jgi:hypothetical protein
METLTIACASFAYSLAFTLSLAELDYGSLPVVIFYFLVNVLIVMWCVVEFIRRQWPRLQGALRVIRRRPSK